STTGSFTYYETGLGACGWYSSDSDYIVALNWEQFDPATPNGNPNDNTLCGSQIQANYNGNSVVVTVVDRCAGCSWGDLDFSPAAFSQLADL
ncbi:RlpA-like double-psi beta-barrel-protein domain-containing protein-containing protein, partial [Podospora appendiculata]